MKGDFFQFPPAANPENPLEFFETLLIGAGGVRVERIISHGQSTPEGEWYDQDEDEWVVVLEGNAAIGFPDGSEISLDKGGHCFLPKHARHRVARTSSPCVWLAVFAESLKPRAENDD